MSDLPGGPADSPEPGTDPTTVQPAAEQPDAGADGSGSSRPPWLIPLLIVLAIVAGGLVFALVSSSDDDNDCDGDDVAAAEVALAEAEIRVLQQDLTDLGYYSCAVNGIYNQQTVDAVKELQTELGVTADGIVGPETLAAIAELLAGGSTSSSSSSSSTAPSETTSTTQGSTTPPESTPEVELTVDGGPTWTFEVTRCDSPSESTVTLTGETADGGDVVELELEAEDGEGTIVVSGGDEAEGTVDSVQVGDTGAITASGDLAPSDDSAESASFRLEGQCA